MSWRKFALYSLFPACNYYICSLFKFIVNKSDKEMCEEIKSAIIIKPLYELRKYTLRLDVQKTETKMCFIQDKNGKQIVVVVTWRKELLHSDPFIEYAISVRM